MVAPTPFTGYSIMALPLPSLFLGLVLVSAMITDLRFQKIPNYLTYPTILLAFLYHSITMGYTGLFFSLKGLGLGMGALMVFHFLGAMGAGDVKLMGAVGAVLGPSATLYALLCTALVGGIYALIVLTLNTEYLKSLMRRLALMGKTLVCTGHVAYVPAADGEAKIKLCYGVAIAIGTLGFVVWEYLRHTQYAEFFTMLLNK